MGSLEMQSFLGYDANQTLDFETISDDSTRQLLLVTTGTPTKSWRYKGLKRAIDVVFSALMLLVCLVPGLLIALAVALSSNGPIFYREVRVGRGRRPFRIWKFRSMRSQPFLSGRNGAHLEVLSRWRTTKDIHDPRITRVGHFLRKWSLDELPQLINVFCGDMSLVGPRPVVRAELPHYKHLLPFYLEVTPGLSGLWQVSGRSDVSFSSRAKLDASYVRSWSLRQDLIILMRTVPAVLYRVGAR